MSIYNHIKTYLLCSFIFSSLLFAKESTTLVTKEKKKTETSTTYTPRNTWKPYFTWVGNFQQRQNVYSEINIGIGFLYFDDVNANLGNQPTNIFSMIGSTPDKRDISYSKTPLFEYIIGYQFTNWLKFGISFQNQSNIRMQTRTLDSQNSNAKIEFGADIQLNALIGKFCFELPWPLVWKTIAFTPYLAGGTGVTWQSWSNILDRISIFSSNAFIGTDVPYRQKTIANVAGLADLGLRVHSAYPDSGFSMTAGCKYNYWGQVRNLGELNQQGNYKRGLLQPFRIKMLYSFAPYIGLNWNFPVTKNNIVAQKNANSEDVFYASPKGVHNYPSVLAQISIGPNFLYFSKLRGNLVGVPQDLFFGSGPSIPLNRRLSYIRSPLIEYLLGYRANRWLELGISYQNQNETMILSRWFSSPNTRGFSESLTQFQSYLNLNALMGKVSIDLFSAIVNDMAFTPFIGVGVGASWQSWTDIKLERTAVITGSFTNNFLYLRDAIIANASWMVDSGIKLRNANPNFLFSLVAGCRYNQWGQVRNIGEQSKQGGLGMGLFKPITAKILYSFSPYLGMQWDFPVDYKFQIGDKSINTWVPFITNAKNIQKRFSLLVQANVGAGILFFDKIRGNFGGIPAFNFEQNGSSPFKGQLRYNITPVFEYILGYRFYQWFKAAIAYQSQKSIFVSTEPLIGFGATADGAKNQFRAHLDLDAFMLKLYFELPLPLVFKGYAISPYVALSPGIGWQSWKNMSVNRILNAESSVGLSSLNQSIRQKIIANFVWMAEGGFRVRNASPNFPFSGVFGCKYVQWGQTRNIGELSQQANNFRVAIFKPFSIKVLGSVVPYVGLQWNF